MWWIPVMSFDSAIKAKGTGQMATIDQLIEEFIIENPVESEKAAKTLVIGCMIYDKNKDGNRMLT